jgi:diadenosine tetraphosphatase ApaH/serine/threonine PP2A family protein phosphatase
MDVEAWLSSIRSGQHLKESDLVLLLNKLAEVLYQESTLLSVPLPITICGDLHGQLYDVFELFKVSGGVEANHYLFLGDYVDRGWFSIETFSYLAALKLRYPDRISLLRGNHECRAISRTYGLYDESISRYGHAGVWKLLNDVFDLLPLAALVGGDIFCVHGGLSPTIRFVEQIPTFERKIELPSYGPLCDLAWSDPEPVEDWGENLRGAGRIFGRKQTNKFCHENNIQLICRAHQIAMKGYEWHFEEEQIVTVWSAPNYSYKTVNDASVLKIDRQKKREFVLFKAVPDSQRVIPEEIQPAYFA